MGTMRGATLLVFFASTMVCAQAPTEQQRQNARPSARTNVEQHLDDGRRLYRELDFAGCVDAMTRALSITGGADAQRLEAFEILGAAYVVLDRPADAEAAFRSMFELDAYHVVREPSGSPKIERFVEELRAQIVPDAALDPSITLRPTLPRATRAGVETPVAVDVVGPTVSLVELVLRTDDETLWRRLSLQGDHPHFEGNVDALPAAGSLELYFEARDEAGRVVARAGEPLLPLTLAIRRGSQTIRTPLRRRWWLWTIVGAVLLGAAIGIGIAASSGGRAPAGTLPPGRVVLPLR